jgi:hypothetical protein
MRLHQSLTICSAVLGALLIGAWVPVAAASQTTLLVAQDADNTLTTENPPSRDPAGTDPASSDPVDSRTGNDQSSLRQTLSVALVTMGVASIVFILMRNLRKLHRVQHEMDKPPQERVAALRGLGDRSSDPQVIMAQSQQIAQRLVSQLEAKAVRIEALLDHAEARLAHYESVLQDLESRGTSVQLPHDRHQIQASPQASPQGTAQAASRPLHGGGDAPPRIDPLHQRVHELADQGLDPIEIARRIERPTGQVELILALRRA